MANQNGVWALRTCLLPVSIISSLNARSAFVDPKIKFSLLEMAINLKIHANYYFNE
jgi:hypothetical protein